MHRRATASARSLDGGVLPQHRGNSRRIPDTVAVPGTVSGPHQEGSWHGGEGVGYQDLAGASLQHQDMLGGETLEGCADVVRRRPASSGVVESDFVWINVQRPIPPRISDVSQVIVPQAASS